MKRLVLLALVIIVSLSSAFAQKKVFMDLTCWYKTTAGAYYAAQVDYGQTWSIHLTQSGRNLVNENGNDIHFTSTMQAVNYLVDRGWDLFAVYPNTNPNRKVSDPEVTYVLYKLINSEEEITEGFLTKDQYTKQKKEEK